MPKKPKINRVPSGPVFPPGHPDALAIMADAMPWKTTAKDFPLESYVEAINKLRTRGYSYAEIANWLTGQLAKELAGKKIRRGQVYRVYQQWLEQSEAESWGHIGGVRAISEEEAEKEAEIEDKKPPESTEEKKP